MNPKNSELVYGSPYAITADDNSECFDRESKTRCATPGKKISEKNQSIYDQETLHSADRLPGYIEIPDDDITTVFTDDPTLLSNSPYPEVRQNVPLDDEEVRLNHWRTWFLVTVFVAIFAAINQFFSLRYPTLSVNFIVAQVICFPVGNLFGRLPDIQCHKCRFFDLNPGGKFSKKEHALITICVSLTSSTAYAMNILIAQTNFYNMDVNFGYEILLVMSTQMAGYGLAGLTRRWIVYPASAIWPQTLISVSLFDALNDKGLDRTIVNGWKASRYKFFLVAFCISFVWYWFPGFLFKGLGYFSIVLWGPLTRNNFVVNSLFGVESGLGLLPITFDYTQISQAMSGSVFATPFWVVANTYGSVFLFFVLILPILYYTNTWDAKYMPMISSSTFDNTQSKFNVSKVLNPDYTINLQKYKEYSPIFVPFSYLLSYALNFAAVVGIFVHTYLYHGHEIWEKLKNAKNGGEDIHKRMMNKYKEAPDWWYAIVFVSTVGLSFLCICIWQKQFPAWGLVIAYMISIINFVPQGVLESITNQHVGLNIITELVAGYMMPLRPMANLLFKLTGYVTTTQGLSLSKDLKLAQYCKIPPRILFFAQLYSTIIASFIMVGLQDWMRKNIKGVCTTDQPDGFICSDGRTVFNASIIWSLPGHLFSFGKRYHSITWFFLIGAFCPVITWLLWRRYPNKWYGKLSAPVFFTGPGNIPPSTVYNYSLYFVASFFLNKFIGGKWPRWHAKYNYVMGAAVEAGVAVATVVIFLCITYPGVTLTWWGNQVYKDTLDWKSKPYYTVKSGETFGPSSWL
ncbi:oligopeptide transporter [Saccharomycopsis crataegensis]|uniref:Oligopeptide transporter n=1 Tax=Saccharomycopsis crataegensis TaxID=43959 RepID=A0AAV5QTL4_9ASCO|nr:oligopeptide transporter [Saccharomycopsis crataegensis]